MSEWKENMEQLANDLRAYAEVRVNLMKLKLAEKMSRLLGTLVAAIAVGIAVLLFFSFASIGVAILVGKWLGNLWLGFVILGAFYLLAGLIVWRSRRSLIQIPAMNAIIQQLFEEDSHEKNPQSPRSEEGA